MKEKGIKDIVKDLNISETDLYDCINFSRKFPTLS